MDSRIIGWVAATTLTIVMLAAAVWISGCGDSPTEPKKVRDYPVYFCQPDLEERIYRFHPATRTIDSMDIPWQPVEGITVSADGERLYLAQTNSVVVVDADSATFITQLPYAPDGPVAVSPDGRMVAIANHGLHVLDATNYTLIFEDSVPVIHGVFSSDSRVLYCVRKGTNAVYMVNLADSTFPVTSKPMSNGALHYAVPTPNESLVLMYSLHHLWTYSFAVYDVAADSIVFQDILSPGAGHLALTPDGRYAFYTNPGRTATDPPPDFSLTVFDIHQNQVKTVIADTAFCMDSTSWYAPPSRLAITPDGRWLVVLGGQMNLGILYLFDIRKGEYVFRETWNNDPTHVFGNLTTQNTS